MFFGAFALYLKTLSPSVTFWDSGELVAAAWQLGIPHQPGYPVFCMLGRLFSFIPLGSVAYRVNLMSAAFGALAVYVLYLAIREAAYTEAGAAGPGGAEDKAGAGAGAGGLPGVCRTVLPALFALFFAVVRVYWSQAVVAEVYALNASFMAVLVLLHVRATRGVLPPARYVMLSGLLFGLGLVNHASMVLYAPALLISWVVTSRGRVCAGAWAGAAGFAALGLTAYLYLPLRSLAGPGLDIGHPDNWERFVWVIRWGDYVRAAGGAAGSVPGLLKRMDVADPKITAAAAAAALIAWRLLRRDWRLYLPVVVFAGVYALGISTQALSSERDIAFGLSGKFFAPVYMLVIVLIAAASAEVLPSVRASGSGYAGAAVCACLAGLILYTGYVNLGPNDNSRHYMAYDYAANSLKSADEGGVLFTWGDNGVFPLWYLSQVERYRDDVVLIHTPLMTYAWYLEDVRKRLSTDPGFAGPYYLGENVYKVYKAVTPGRKVAYDYSTTRFLKLDYGKLKVRGLVYYEGDAPPGTTPASPWGYYVFRGVDDPKLFKGPMEKNIIQIYDYQRGLAGGGSPARQGGI